MEVMSRCRAIVLRSCWLHIVMLFGLLSLINDMPHEGAKEISNFSQRRATTVGQHRNRMFVDAAIQQETKPKMCHYEVLGVPRDVKDAKLKKAYKKSALYVSLSFSMHPTVGDVL